MPSNTANVIDGFTDLLVLPGMTIAAIRRYNGVFFRTGFVATSVDVLSKVDEAIVVVFKSKDGATANAECNNVDILDFFVIAPPPSN